jgi:FkbM family methyltransferase
MLRRARTRLAARASRLGLLADSLAQHRGPVPDLAGTVEIETTFARLLLDERDEVIRPALEATAGWEPGETALLGGHLKPGMTVVDGGAHVGYYTCLAARLVGPRGLVLAFEPSPRNYELLLANVWRNGFTNVVCYPWALGAENGVARLALSETNTGDNRVGADGVPVRVAALDALEALRPPVDVVKLDVQGGEGDALRGMERLLAASPDVLVTLEFWPQGIRDRGGEPGAALDWYRTLGFELRVQHPDEKGVLDWPDERLLEFCGAEGHTNLVLTRSR